MAKKSSLKKSTSKTSDFVVGGVLFIAVVVMGIYHITTVMGSLMINRPPKA